MSERNDMTYPGGRTHPIWQIPPAGAGPAAVPSTAAAAALGVGVVAAVLAPWFVHLAPVTAPGLGPVLLPMFYAPLLAALLWRLPPAVALSAATPFVARLMTGLPADPVLGGLVIQVAVFVVVARVLRRAQWAVVAPAAYLAGVGVSALVTPLTSGMANVDFVATLQTGWPGVAALTVIGAVAHRTLR